MPFLVRVYSGYSCTQGLFLTPCKSDPSLRGLKNILRLYVKKCKGNSRFKSSYLIIYGSGGHPLGNLFPEYLGKKGFVEAHADDGLLEVFGLKQGWHASFVMVELISAKHIAQMVLVE
ncbi:hypothetical protein QYF36_005747 [Acer negundo]|nr:hypothetical protein QYF36_005747 [Acer negundo]